MKRLIVALAIIAALVAFFLLLPEPEAPQPEVWPDQAGNSFMLRGVTVFHGNEARERRDVLVEDGLITAVSPKVPLPEGVPEFAGEGHALMPAFIDAHTHNFGTSRVDALRFGVGTQLDMFSDVSMLGSARKSRGTVERTDQADMWSAGTLVTSAGGHGTQFGRPVATLDDAGRAEGFIADRVAEGSDFIKLVLEPGFAIGREVPTLSTETLTAAIAAAKAHDKLALVHVSTGADAMTAIEAGADGLVHLFGDVEIGAALVERMRARGVFVIATLAVLESVSGLTSGLDTDPRVAPYLTPVQRESLTRPFPGGGERGAIIERAKRNVHALFEAGVPILAGSDAPNPGTAHGASLHRELELLVESGLTPAEALTAATATPAEYFGLDDRGRIARGLRADLVLVAGDPLTDITATREIVAVWKNGYRIERPHSDGKRGSAATLDNGMLGGFADGEDGWTPTTDSIQGGKSGAIQNAVDGALAVSGEVKAGGMWPWAGTIRTFGARPFDPVDASEYPTLVLRVKGDGGGFSVLFFSGEGGQAPPLTWSFQSTGDWQELEIPLGEITGLDRAHLRAIALVAGPETRAFRFELDAAVLR